MTGKFPLPVRLALVAAFALLVLAYLALEVLVIGYERAHFSAHPLLTRDFANYWMAARLAAEGSLQTLFDPVAYLARLRAEFGADYPWHAWSYPPHFLFFCLPLLPMPYFVAWAAFLGATLLFFLAGARAFVLATFPQGEGRAIWRDALFGLLPLAFIVANIRFAQNGFLTAGLLLFALANWRSRPLVAGIFLGLLTIKPQLGLLLPLLLLLDRNWTAILAACATAALLALASVAAFGWQPWIDYVNLTLPYQGRVLTEFGAGDAYPAMMLSAFAAARVLGLDAAAAWAAHAPFALAGLVLLAKILRNSGDDANRFAALLLATFLVVPYTFNYDAGALVVVCAALAVRSRGEWRAAADRGIPAPALEYRYRMLCLAGALPILANLLAVYVAPLGPAILLAILASLAFAAGPGVLKRADRPAAA